MKEKLIATVCSLLKVGNVTKSGCNCLLDMDDKGGFQPVNIFLAVQQLNGRRTHEA